MRFHFSPFTLIAALFAAASASAQEFNTIGVCEVVVSDLNLPPGVIDRPSIGAQAYTGIDTCRLLEPARCRTEWNAIFWGTSAAARLMRKGRAVAYWRWDCLPWQNTDRIPAPSTELQPAPLPTDQLPQNPTLNFDLERLVRALRDVWNSISEHYDALPWDVIIAVSVILIGLGLLKGGQLALTGPGAAEPVSLAIAICAIVVLIWPYLPASEQAKYRDFNQAGVIEKEDGAWVITNPLDGKKTRIVIGADGAWSSRTPAGCVHGTSDATARTVGDGEDC